MNLHLHAQIHLNIIYKNLIKFIEFFYQKLRIN